MTWRVRGERKRVWREVGSSDWGGPRRWNANGPLSEIRWNFGRVTRGRIGGGDGCRERERERDGVRSIGRGNGGMEVRTGVWRWIWEGEEKRKIRRK